MIYKQSGTHVGELMGIEPSNNRWEQFGYNLVTLDDDERLVDVFDQLELLYQLDAVPEDLKEISQGLTARPGA